MHFTRFPGRHFPGFLRVCALSIRTSGMSVAGLGSQVFVQAHLNAFQKDVRERNEDYTMIVDQIRLGDPQLDLLHQFDHVFLLRRQTRTEGVCFLWGGVWRGLSVRQEGKAKQQSHGLFAW